MEIIPVGEANTPKESHTTISYSHVKKGQTVKPDNISREIPLSDPFSEQVNHLKQFEALNYLLVEKGLKKIIQKDVENKNKRKQSKKWYEKMDIVLFCISTIFYVAIVFNQFKMDIRFKIQRSIREYFGFTSSFINWGPNDFVTTYFNGILEKLVYEEFWFLDHKYEMISSLRITQRKLKKELVVFPSSCLLDKQYFTEPQIVVDNISPYELYNANNEDNETFGEGYTFQFDKNNSFFGYGGYVMSFLKSDIYTDSVKNITDDMSLRSQLIINNTQAIQDKFKAFVNWETTASITFDFLLAYYEYSYLLNVVITFETSRVGMGTLLFNMYIVDKNIYSHGWAYFRTAIEGIYVLSLFLYIAFVVAYVRFQIQEKKEISETMNSANKKSTVALCLQVLSQDWLTIFLVVSFVFSVAGIVLWIVYVIVLYQNMELLTTAFSEYDRPVPLQTQNDVLFVAKTLEQYRALVAVNLLFLFIRLIKMLQHYHKPTQIFTLTMAKAISDIISFFAFFFIILCGFSVFSMFFYGRVLPMFTDFFWSFQNNFALALGIFDSIVIDAMYGFNPSITILYFLLMIIFLRLIITKILLAIITYYFRIAIDRYSEKEKKKYDLISYSTKSEIPRGYLMVIIHGFHYYTNCCWDYLCCRRKQKQTCVNFGCNYTKSKLKEIDCVDISDDKDILLETQSLNRTDNLERSFSGVRVMLYNAKYSGNSDFEIRNAKLESENDLRKIQYYYEKKYRSVFADLLIFVLFTGGFILMFILNTLSPWLGKFHSYFQNNFSSRPYDEISSPFYHLTNTEEVRNFLFLTLPSMFNRYIDPDTGKYEDYYLETNNILLCNSLTYTIKRQQVNQDRRPSDDTVIFFFEDSVRRQEPMSVEKMEFENKTYYQYIDPNSSTVYPIINEKYPTYRKHGGYVFNFDMDQWYNLTVYPPVQFTEILIDTYLTYAITEFFLQNKDFEVVVYVRLEINSDWGTLYRKHAEIAVLKYEYVHSHLDYLKFAMEVMFIILLVYFFIKFVVIIIQESNSYDKWYKEKIAPLKLIEKEIRYMTIPEFIRKLHYIFTMTKLIDLLIIILSLILLHFRAQIAHAEVSLGRLIKGNQEYNKFELRDIIYQGIDAKSSYDVIGNIIIFFSCLKFISMLKISKYLSLLIRTLKDSRANNFTFILILFFIQPCFLFFSHLIFGERSEKFDTFGTAFMSCIQIVFGYAYFVELKNANPIFGPIFFFGYLVLINMIFLNLFVSILYASYITIKSEILKTVELWSWKAVFLCCCSKLKKFSYSENNLKMIESEFELENQAMKYDTKMSLNQEKNQVHDWVKNEINQIKILDDHLFLLRKRKQDMTNAFQNAKNRSDNIFEDFVYKGIQENHLRSYSTYYLNCVLTLTDQLEEDILSIERAKKYIQKHRVHMKYDETLKMIRGKEALLLKEIAEIDKKFMELREDIAKLHGYQIEREQK